MGLWAAVHAERLGLDTLLVDSGRLGEGASGGLLGALMSYSPDAWDEKKQFQFDALVALEDEIANLEASTGHAIGYRRCGRLIPLPKPHLRVIAETRCPDADRHWRSGERQFHWRIEDMPRTEGWPRVETAAAGLVHETFAARVAPRRLGAALKTFLGTARHVRIIENCAVSSIDAELGAAHLSNGDSVSFGHCIVSAGFRSFPMLEKLGAPLPVPLGQAVKGQSALLAADVDPDLPMIFLDGVYIVPHEAGTVAIGSTSENRFDTPYATDAQLEKLIARARQMAPVLENAAVIERWAGLRPKAIDRDPMVGSHPDHPDIIALTGGFKISFGMAHSLAKVALSVIDGQEPAVPSSFLLASHLAVASR